MAQQKLFPNQVPTAGQPQRAANSLKAAQPAASMNRQASEPQNRTVQFRQPPNTSLQPSGPNGAAASALSSEGKAPGHIRLFGRIGRYFDIKTTSTGKLLATFSLATQKPYRDESGNWLKRTVWQRIVVWEEAAQSLAEQLRKGARVSVEGKFKTREWTDRENNLHTTTELVAREVHFLDAAAA